MKQKNSTTRYNPNPNRNEFWRRMYAGRQWRTRREFAKMISGLPGSYLGHISDEPLEGEFDG